MVTITVAMCKACATAMRCKWAMLGSLLGLLALCPVPANAQGVWYFLSGTSTEDTPKHYPSVLYTSDKRNKLRAVRQVVSGADGVHSIHSYGRVAFIAYPHLPPSTLSVVHVDAPELPDDVPFNPEGQIVVDDRMALAKTDEHQISQLVWLVPPGNIPAGTVLNLTSERLGMAARLKKNAWNEYSSLRFEGIPGGPVTAADLVGAFDGNTIGIKLYTKYVIVDRFSTDLARKLQGETPYFIGVTDEHLVFGIQHHATDLHSGALSKRTQETLYIHDRQANHWTTIALRGTCSRTRIFGPWLATIVQFWNPQHPPNPGASNERSVETDTLPNVRELYSIFAGRNCSIPGDLALHNLKTGQTILFHTGQEDSEILQVEGDTVLYRVNDAIYRARIVGDELRDTTLEVKDQDVPEIHWAFWSD